MKLEETTMTRRNAGIGALVACLAAGCATHWAVEHYAVPGADVSAKQTFYWKGGDVASSTALTPATLASAESHVRTAVVSELTRKGYTEAATATAADMIVSYQIAGVRKFVSSETPRIGAPSARTVLSPSETQPPPASTVPREVAVRDSAVIIFIDDGTTGKLLWRGEVAAETRVTSTEQTVRVLEQMAREIGKDVPARAGAVR